MTAPISEVWRSVVGHPNYQVSNLGRVRSMKFREATRLEPKILKQTVNPDTGYLMLSLGRRTKTAAHTLVCEAFHGPCPDGHECAHGDGVRANNRADNLAWKTPADNRQDKLRHGTWANGERIAQHKLTAKQVMEIRGRDPAMFNMHHVAAEFSVSVPTIHRVWHGHTWRHLLKK
jgi:hypothetical protein